MFKKILLVFLILCGMFFYFLTERVEIIYFYNEDCILINQTDTLVENSMKDFGKKIKLTKIDPFNPKENEHILISKYNANSVPLIIINGELYVYEYNYTLFKNEICKKLIFKPKECKQ